MSQKTASVPFPSLTLSLPSLTLTLSHLSSSSSHLPLSYLPPIFFQYSLPSSPHPSAVDHIINIEHASTLTASLDNLRGLQSCALVCWSQFSQSHASPSNARGRLFVTCRFFGTRNTRMDEQRNDISDAPYNETWSWPPYRREHTGTACACLF